MASVYLWKRLSPGVALLDICGNAAPLLHPPRKVQALATRVNEINTVLKRVKQFLGVGRYWREDEESVLGTPLGIPSAERERYCWLMEGIPKL
ncbi:hypothetical protein QE152_g23409 [Popillia japonica]|uniref:Uncharacterized protein n=1 Tax=Popillia japonica TaxID=7064 RepID=A0AAW1KIK1_POPJA